MSGLLSDYNDASHFAVFHHGEKVAEVQWNVVGQHNMHNAYGNSGCSSRGCIN